MKHIKLFEDFENFVPKETKRPYVNGRKILDTIIVDSHDDFDDNPLFYIWSEYPKYKLMKNNRLHASYEFYLDKDGNRYFVTNAPSEFTDEDLEKLIQNHNWNIARNVDTFVENADKEDYKQWLYSIS